MKITSAAALLIGKERQKSISVSSLFRHLISFSLGETCGDAPCPRFGLRQTDNLKHVRSLYVIYIYISTTMAKPTSYHCLYLNLYARQYHVDSKHSSSLHFITSQGLSLFSKSIILLASSVSVSVSVIFVMKDKNKNVICSSNKTPLFNSMFLTKTSVLLLSWGLVIISSVEIYDIQS